MRRYGLMVSASMICFMMALVSMTSARQSGPQPGESLFPIVPMIIEYEHSPQYFMQWISDDPNYSLIQASLSKDEEPVYLIILTEKESGRRVYYCNSESKVKRLSLAGKEARVAKIDFRAVKQIGQETVYGFGLSDERGQAIRWRIIPAGDPSERGAGLSPQGDGPGLWVLYRDLSTAAGEGTAIQIGDRLSEAAPWPEISAPPYFVAYRGAYVEGMGAGALLAGSENWRVISSPEELKEGAEWTLSNDRGYARRLRITEMRGDELTITEINSQTSDSTTLSLSARKTARGFALRSIELSSGGHLMRVGFKPEMDLSTEKAEINFQIDQNGRENLILGKVSLTRREGALNLRWQPESPSWAKPLKLNATIRVSAGAYKIEVR